MQKTNHKKILYLIKRMIEGYQSVYTFDHLSISNLPKNEVHVNGSCLLDQLAKPKPYLDERWIIVIQYFFHSRPWFHDLQFL